MRGPPAGFAAFPRADGASPASHRPPNCWLAPAPCRLAAVIPTAPARYIVTRRSGGLRDPSCCRPPSGGIGRRACPAVHRDSAGTAPAGTSAPASSSAAASSPAAAWGRRRSPAKLCRRHVASHRIGATLARAPSTHAAPVGAPAVRRPVVGIGGGVWRCDRPVQAAAALRLGQRVELAQLDARRRQAPADRAELDGAQLQGARGGAVHAGGPRARGVGGADARTHHHALVLPDHAAEPPLAPAHRAASLGGGARGCVHQAGAHRAHGVGPRAALRASDVRGARPPPRRRAAAPRRHGPSGALRSRPRSPSRSTTAAAR